MSVLARYSQYFKILQILQYRFQSWSMVFCGAAVWFYCSGAAVYFFTYCARAAVRITYCHGAQVYWYGILQYPVYLCTSIFFPKPGIYMYNEVNRTCTVYDVNQDEDESPEQRAEQLSNYEG
jgi:hypothetical protein